MDATVTLVASDEASDGASCAHTDSSALLSARHDIDTSAGTGDAADRVDELEETVHALKLLNEKHAAELNAKELLLTRKSERIDELLQQLRARDAQFEAANSELHAHTTRCEQLQSELAELHDQLRKDEDDFAMVAAALAAQEQAATARTQELAAAREAERVTHKELDKAQVVIRRLERNVEELQPETADACLSPRSFHENQLIALRDDAIAARTQEVWLLSGQNAQLRVQLDDLEAAMAQLETHALTKENDVARKQRRIDKLTVEIEALQASRSQAEGRERAMEIATTQNHQLLVALEAQERAAAELEERATRAERECEQLRVARVAFLEKAAESDVEVLYRTREAEERSAAVSSLQDKLQRERRALQHELANARLQHQVEVEKMQSELVMRRTKQYELTLKLQDAEARLHSADGVFDTTREQLLATTCRMNELERVLQDALQWKTQLEAQLAAQCSDAATAQESIAQQLRVAQSETVALSAQLAELKDAVVQRSNQVQRLERDARDSKALLESKDALVREQRERIARLVREVNREAQARAELELERQLLREQLETLRAQTESALRDVEAQRRRSDDKLQRLRDTLEQLEGEIAKERTGKAKLIARLAEAFTAAAAMAASGSVAVRSTTASSSVWASAESLDLRECSLSDQDLPPLLRMLEHAPDALTRVDLRSNRITQDGMRTVAAFAKKLAMWLGGSEGGNSRHHCRVRDIDLRHNYVALDGVRTVASGLESLLGAGGAPRTNQSQSDAGGQAATTVKSVVVKSGGRIECFSDAKPEQATGVPPVLIIDISANFDADVLVAEARKFQRRRGRESDGGTGVAVLGSIGSPKSHLASTQRDQLLIETYGVDLVDSLLGSDSGPASVMQSRRKASSSLQFEKPKPAALLPAAATPQSSQSPRENTGAAAVAVVPRGSAATLNSAQRTLSGTSVVSDTGSGTRLLGSSSLPKLSG